MALIFADGFDHYVSADLLRKWSSVVNLNPGSDCGVGPTQARPPGGQGLFIGGATNRMLFLQLPASYATLICGFNFYQNSNSNGSGVFIAFRDGGTTQVDLRLNGAGRLQITRNGTVLATSTNVFALKTWYHIEIKATIHNTAGAYEVRVNGSSVGWIPAATAQNTRASANNSMDTVMIVMPNIEIWFDDFYFLDTSGSTANDFQGPTRIMTLYPRGVGAHSDWSGSYSDNFANVNEPTADGDGTFNQSSVPGDKDTFAMDDVPASTIVAIQHVIQMRQDAGAQRQVRAVERQGGTDYGGTTFQVAGTHLFYLDPKSVNPATSAAFTDTEINGDEFGYELVS